MKRPNPMEMDSLREEFKRKCGRTYLNTYQLFLLYDQAEEFLEERGLTGVVNPYEIIQ